MQTPRSKSTSVKRLSRDHKMPRYQTTEMHYEWSFERLARYVSRPAVSTERLSELPDGRLLYRLKRRWRNGTTEVVFQRSDFIAKLAALVPAPRAHLRTYHGISRSRRQMASSDRSHTGRAIRRMRPRSRPARIQPTPGKRTGRDGVRASAAKKKLFMVRASETGVRN